MCQRKQWHQKADKYSKDKSDALGSQLSLAVRVSLSGRLGRSGPRFLFARGEAHVSTANLGWLK